MYAPYGLGTPPRTSPRTAIVLINGAPASFGVGERIVGLDGTVDGFFDIFNPVKVAQVAIRAATGNPNIVVTSIGHIPVISELTSIVSGAASAPFRLASSIASGERIDKALVDHFKRDLALIKEAAPLAQAVISFVPGVGTGVSAAIGAGVALAEGRSLDEAAKAAIRGAVPGGPAAVAAFDAALAVVQGENVGKAAIEAARTLVPPSFQKAFDIGVAVATGENIQNALAQGLATLAPAQIKSLVESGKKTVNSVPTLTTAIKAVAAGPQQEGFRLAAGLLSQAGINEKALTSVRGKLDPIMRLGFDAALKSQTPTVAWLKNVTDSPPVIFVAPMKPRPPTEQEVALKMLAALMVWGKNPSDVAAQQQLAGVSWQWAATMQGKMKPEDTRLADAINAWVKSPNDTVLKEKLINASEHWGRAKGVLPTKPPPVLKAPTKPSAPVVVTAATPVPAVPPSVKKRGAYAPYPPML